MDLSPLTTADLAIKLHVACAVVGLGLGPVALFRSSRDWVHKLAGRVWIVAMFGTALSSFFITDIRMIGPFSPIHILSVMTLVGLVQGISAVVRGDYLAHGRAMRALYLQSMVVAGVFTFLPGRRMNVIVFAGHPDQGFAAAMGAGVVILAMIWFAPGLRRVLRRPDRA